MKQSHVALSVKVQPRSSKDEIIGEMNDELRIKLKAPPVDSAANNALIHFLAETLNCSRSQLQLALGHTSRHKTIHITSLPILEIVPKLRAAITKK